MVTTPILSIIVPVYNVEHYLPKCIDSILAQTFSDFELILINDGSPDTCPLICDEYAAKDERIRVIHQQNAGVSVARNCGLDIARGKYIAFVDSDDYLDSSCYERMLTSMERNDCEMAICGFLYEYPNGATERRSAEGEERILSHKELMSALVDIPWSIRTGTCNKIFNRHTINSLRFDTNKKCCEDTLFFHQYMMRYEGNAVFIREPLYINFQRQGSAMHGALSMADIEQSLAVHKQIANDTGKLYPELYSKAYAYYLDSCVWKLNANKTPHLPETSKAIRQRKRDEMKIRRRIMKEWYGILTCPLIGWKQKIFYTLVALNLR